MVKIDQKTQTLFSIWVEDVSTAYDVLEQDMTAQIRRMRTLGMSDREIYDRLFASLNNGMDMFQTFKGAIGRSNDTLVNTISQVESNEAIREEAELWKWDLDPTAKDHCEDCLKYSLMEPMGFDDWEEIGLPGYGNTQCHRYCRCTLSPL